MKQLLTVPLPGGPVLNAGVVELGEEVLTVVPPSPSLFDQLLEHLEPLPRLTSRSWTLTEESCPVELPLDVRG